MKIDTNLSTELMAAFGRRAYKQGETVESLATSFIMMGASLTDDEWQLARDAARHRRQDVTVYLRDVLRRGLDENAKPLNQGQILHDMQEAYVCEIQEAEERITRQLAERLFIRVAIVNTISLIGRAFAGVPLSFRYLMDCIRSRLRYGKDLHGEW